MSQPDLHQYWRRRSRLDDPEIDSQSEPESVASPAFPFSDYELDYPEESPGMIFTEWEEVSAPPGLGPRGGGHDEYDRE